MKEAALTCVMHYDNFFDREMRRNMGTSWSGPETVSICIKLSGIWPHNLDGSFVIQLQVVEKLELH